MLDDARGNINDHIHTLSEHLMVPNVCSMYGDVRFKINVHIHTLIEHFYSLIRMYT